VARGCLYLVGRGRQLLWAAQPKLSLDDDELHTPDAPEQVNRWELCQYLWRVRCPKRLQQSLAIGTDGGGVRQACLPSAGQPIVFDAAAIALVPFWRRDGPQPVWRFCREGIQNRAECLGHAFEPVEHPQRAQDVGGVGLLSPPGFQPAVFTAHGEQPL
jgi:hypothetical protein